MGAIEKVLEYVLEKNGVRAIISFILAFLLQILIPKGTYKDIYNRLPFENNINVILVFVTQFLLIYIILQFVMFLIKKISHALKSQSPNISQSDTEKQIELFQSAADKWSEKDYSIIMYLINSQNQVPYTTRNIDADSILHNDELFSKTMESKPEKVYDTKGDFWGTLPTQYQKVLLKTKFYDLCKIVLNEKGKLSHFERKTIDLHQED